LSHTLRRVLWTLLLGACLAGLWRQAPANLFALAGAAAVTAEGEGYEHEAVLKWINFFILVGALGYFLRKPVRGFFAQRSSSIRKSLDEARKALEASQAQLQAVEEKLRHFEEEMAAFKDAAAREMQAERERLRQATAQEAEKIMQSMRAQMETATRAARLELKRYTGEQAVELAETAIRQRLDEGDQRRLVEQFMARLGQNAKPN
jgi:F-type H+-transporting ATPase subunit b